MTGDERPQPRRVVVTRIGADSYLVVVGDVVIALNWMELTCLAAEVGEALDSSPCRPRLGS